jgi:hypothetical protein
VLEQHNFSSRKQIDLLEVLDFVLHKKQCPEDTCGIIKRKIKLLEQAERETTAAESNLYLSTKKGVKVDFIRVMNNLCELGFFTDRKGNEVTKKEVFKTFENTLNCDFSTFQNILSTTKAAAKSDMKSTLSIFQQLYAKQQEINNK